MALNEVSGNTPYDRAEERDALMGKPVSVSSLNDLDSLIQEFVKNYVNDEAHRLVRADGRASLTKLAVKEFCDVAADNFFEMHRAELEESGFDFDSETDSEVVFNSLDLALERELKSYLSLNVMANLR
jgi:hypothetical protein